MCPNSEYDFHHFDFVSDMIRSKVFEHYVKGKTENFLRIMESAKTGQKSRVLYGHLFEEFAHRVLPKLDKIRILKLDESRTSAAILAPNVKVLEERMIEWKIVDNLEDLKEGCYYKPPHGQFPVVDAIVVHKAKYYGFQMAIAKRHGAKEETVNKMLNDVEEKCHVKFVNNNPFNIVFIVDGDASLEFRKQNIKKKSDKENKQIGKAKKKVKSTLFVSDNIIQWIHVVKLNNKTLEACKADIKKEIECQFNKK